MKRLNRFDAKTHDMSVILRRILRVHSCLNLQRIFVFKLVKKSN